MYLLFAWTGINYEHLLLGLNIPLFWGNILKMSIVPGTMIVVGVLLNKLIVIDNWLMFLIGVILFTSIYALAMYMLCMNDYEKDIIRKPLKRLYGMILHR